MQIQCFTHDGDDGGDGDDDDDDLRRQAHNSGNGAGWAGGKTLEPITQLIVMG